MKKFIKVAVSTILALVLTAGLAVTAFASPTNPVVEEVIATFTDADGNTSTITLTEEELADSVKITKEIAANTTPGEDAPAQFTILWQKEVKAPEGTQFPIKITFKLKGVAEGYKSVCFHYEDGAWKDVGDGDNVSVTGTFTSLSPVAIAVIAPAEKPTTGDSSHVVLWGVLMGVAALGTTALVIYDRKRKA